MDSAVPKTKQPVIDREATATEQEHLMRLLNFFENDKLNLGDVKRRLAEVGGEHVSQLASPITSTTLQQMQAIYIDKWPELQVKRGNTILAPSTSRHCTIGGTPISLDMAIDLRKLVYGSVIHSFSREWRRSTLAFQDIDGPYPFGLQTERCSSRGLALCVQGYMLKKLIFDREYKSGLYTTNSLRPSSFERRRALIDGICEMLWQAGEKQQCCVALQQDKACFGPDYRYRFDNITERLHMFAFNKLEDAQLFVKRNLEQAENGCGLVQILYSLVLSRTISKVREDLDVGEERQGKLLTDMEDLTLSLLNLALTGQAVSHLHNGDVLYNVKGDLLPHSLKGVKERASIGFLFWDKDEDHDSRTMVGSMLKTPKTPIWVTKVNNMYGLLFSTNLDLVSDWRIENRFALFYYTGLVSQPMTATLSIETRIGQSQSNTSLGCRPNNSKTPALDNCIMTKWYGANISWNGMLPFV